MSKRAPSMFIGHGSPMNAITDNAFAREWRALGKSIETPRAILCVSAHWQTPTTQICRVDPPQTIHDFYGFPQALFDVRYPAPGAPSLAKRVCELAPNDVTATDQWGLDHGAWQVLAHLFPDANIPVSQLSLSQTYTAQQHLHLAQTLRALRDEGVMLLASGNIVHNLRQAGQATPPAWSVAFDAYVKKAIEANDGEALTQIERAGESARVAVPTDEHYLPLVYAFGARFDDESPRFHTEGYDWGSISMRSVSYGL